MWATVTVMLYVAMLQSRGTGATAASVVSCIRYAEKWVHSPVTAYAMKVECDLRGEVALVFRYLCHALHLIQVDRQVGCHDLELSYLCLGLTSYRLLSILLLVRPWAEYPGLQRSQTYSYN